MNRNKARWAVIAFYISLVIYFSLRLLQAQQDHFLLFGLILGLILGLLLFQVSVIWWLAGNAQRMLGWRDTWLKGSMDEYESLLFMRAHTRAWQIITPVGLIGLFGFQVFVDTSNLTFIDWQAHGTLVSAVVHVVILGTVALPHAIAFFIAPPPVTED